ncbi:MAG TPA: Uma2 family endonuclease [Gemmataceae bacterium]|nr:Uma2 family endonuclease [Gemmataceae bacterium]
MAAITVLGPADHGRPMTREEFESARGQEGYHYELIEGKVYVSPVPDLPHDRIVEWILGLLRDYSRMRPDVINYISTRARVILPGRAVPTNPEPDLAAFHDFPHDQPFGEVSWDDISPILVVEVVSEDDPEKDLERNVALYLEVPSIREYWILDPRKDADHPTMRVYRRRGRRWQRPINVAPGETYATRLLPGFALRLDPHD